MQKIKEKEREKRFKEIQKIKKEKENFILPINNKIKKTELKLKKEKSDNNYILKIDKDIPGPEHYDINDNRFIRSSPYFSFQIDRDRLYKEINNYPAPDTSNISLFSRK